MNSQLIVDCKQGNITAKLLYNITVKEEEEEKAEAVEREVNVLQLRLSFVKYQLQQKQQLCPVLARQARVVGEGHWTKRTRRALRCRHVL